MKLLQIIYRKYLNCITNWFFPIMLFIYPLVKINQGVDVSDSTYSLSNYLYFDRLEGTWAISTYLSNVTGWLLTRLPFGSTLLGMNLYTGLMVSGLTIALYYMLCKWMPAWIAFAGEFIAIGFLWIPTGILYNYMTYVFFALGAMFLYKGLVEEKNKILVAAGVMLGLNVWVRIPNLAEMALVVCVWYYCCLCNKNARVMVQKTGFCIAGYVAGAAVPFIMILIRYGFDGFVKMIGGLSDIQSGDDSYSIISMVKMTLDAYLRTAKWAGFIVAGVVLGFAMFLIKKDSFVRIKKIIYLMGIVVLLRFLWGRGMYSFRYYEDYSSMYEWAMIGLYLAFFACAYLFFAKGVSKPERLWGMVSLVVLCITPLGSNNYTYQNINNLFITAPVTLYAFVKWFRRRYPQEVQILYYPFQAMVSALALMILVQSIGFHMNFVFRDGMDGTKREALLTGIPVVSGMMTTKENAENIQGLLQYIHKSDNTDEILCFGDCPGLAFLLQKPVAIDSAWPDLDSEPISKLEKNLLELKDRPTVIMRHIEPTSDSFMDKQELIFDYMNANHYETAYENDGYIVYCPLEK